MESSLKNNTSTNGPSHVSSETRLALIEVSVLVSVIASSFLIIRGTTRRRIRSSTFNSLVWLAYILSMHLLTCTIGLMTSAKFQNELFALWAMFLLILFATSDSFSAFTLDDNEQWSKYTVQVIFQSFWVGTLIGFYSTHFIFPIVILYFCLLYKVNEREQAFRMASRSSLAKNTKLIADFMAYEHEISNNIEDELDPMYMCRYNYVVAGDDDDDAKMDESVKPPLYYHRLAITDEVITIKKIYRCRGRLLSPTGDPEHKLKDICLSFALYRLLCRRFGGYPFAECNLEKTWNLIRYGLLSKEEDYERAFRVIEQELSFLFDLFYTKYAVIFNGGFRLLASRVALSIGLTMSCFLAVNILSNYKPSKDYVNLLTASGRVNIDKLITGVVIIGICIMEIIQFILIMISNWSKVMWICKYVKNESFQKNKHFELFMKMIIRCRSNSKPWERKLGQYSLLQSFNQDPNIFSRFISKLTGDIIPLPRGGQKESPSIELPWVVKKAVILSLRNNGPKLSNGKASLQRNQVGNLLSWACELETTTHVIIIWHIATNLCRIKLAASKLGRDEDFVTIATALSHYCAYLMTFASRLLPGHAAVTDFIFDRVVNEARKLLDGCESENQKHEKLMNLLCEGEAIFNEEEATLIEKGALLGKHLIEGIEDNGLRWKVLADFWAELMLFVAPSDDARTHAEHLAKGGEFITHLWALLSHAGILKQDQTQTAAV